MLNEKSHSKTDLSIITLQFQTPQQLAAFRKTIERPVKTDIINLILVCHCNHLDLQLAVKNFGATIVE